MVMSLGHTHHPIRTSAGAVLAAGKRNSLLKTNPDSKDVIGDILVGLGYETNTDW
ncbi:hypothetical protein [Thiolapillus sp.]|uniref:hypothetical protein n=1 Tax=Thiolapillus sp. TaxID=2017437 RepID=UPI003AF448DF